jgi:hypothetical protein
MDISSLIHTQIPPTFLAPTLLAKDIHHILGSTITASTIHTKTMDVSTVTGSTIQTNTLQMNTLVGSTIRTGTLSVSTIVGSTIQANTFVTPNLLGSTIQASTSHYSALIGSTISTTTLQVASLIGSTIQTNTLGFFDAILALTTSTTQTNVLEVSRLIGSTVETNILQTSSIIGSTVQSNALIASTIFGSTIRSDALQVSTLYTSDQTTGSTIRANVLLFSTILDSTIQTDACNASTITTSTFQMNRFSIETLTLSGNTVNINGLNITTLTGSTFISNVFQVSTINVRSTFTGSTIQSNVLNGNTIIGSTIQTGTLQASTLTGTTLTGNTVQATRFTGTNITVSTIQTNALQVSTITGSTIQTSQFITSTIFGSTIRMNLLTTSTVIGSTIQTNLLAVSNVIGSTIQLSTIGMSTITGSTIRTTSYRASTIIGSTIQSNTLHASTIIGSSIIGSTIQIPQLIVSTFGCSTIRGSNFQANKILVTNENKALSTLATNAIQLQYIANLTSHAGGIGQTNTWSSIQTFSTVPVFNGVSNAVQSFTLGVNASNQLIRISSIHSGITDLRTLTNYVPYAFTVSSFSTSNIYRVSATDIAIGQITSAFPTGTGTTFSVAGLLQTTNLSATTGTFSKIVMADRRGGLNGTVISGNQGCNFYMGTMNNNGTGNLSDVLYLNSWLDGSAGNINAVMFDKNDFGMRIYQGGVGAASNFTVYRDAVMTDVNSANITIGQGSDTDGITFGPNATWSSFLRVGAGTNRIAATTAQVISEDDGDLMLDSGNHSTEGRGIYLNHYVQNQATNIYSYTPMIHTGSLTVLGNVSSLSWVRTANWYDIKTGMGMYWNAYGRGLVSPEQAGNNYGNVSTWGSGRNGWAGWGLGSVASYMGLNSDFGIHHHVASWLIYCTGTSERHTYLAGSVRCGQTDTRFEVYYNGYNRDGGFYFINASGPFGGAISDERIKKNIKPIDPNTSVEFINGVIPSYFCLKEAEPCTQKKADGTEETVYPTVCSCEQSGFIAQNILESTINAGLPKSIINHWYDYEQELLLPETERKTLIGINETPLVCHLVNALKARLKILKEQQEQISMLQHKLETSKITLNNMRETVRQQGELLQQLTMKT